MFAVRNVAARAARVRLSVTRTATRAMSDKTTTQTGVIPGESEHATGLRREELEDVSIGVERFNRSALWVDQVGTVENPTIIPSMNDHRIVGCPGGCTPEAPTWLRWFIVRENTKTQCPDCGQVFMLDKEAAQQPLE